MEASTIVVGVDGSPGSKRALEFALTEAGRRRSGVHVVTVWSWDAGIEAPLAPVSPTEARADAEQVQRRQLEAALAQIADPPAVTTAVVEGDVAHELVRAAQGVDLLVVGSRGLGPVRSAVLGSVSLRCIRHATCPVVVVPVPHPGEEVREAPRAQVAF